MLRLVLSKVDSELRNDDVVLLQSESVMQGKLCGEMMEYIVYSPACS